MILSGYSRESKAEREALLRTHLYLIRFLVIAAASSSLAFALAPVKKKKISGKQVAGKIALRHVSFAAASTAKAPASASAKTVAAKSTGHWRAPNYADSTAGDIATGEDPIARQAAVQALGKLNGAVVVSDPGTGRILSIVNQKLAFKSGFQPCSTIKVPVALAALSEIGGGSQHPDPPLRQDQHRDDRSAGEVEQPVFCQPGREARVREGELLREAVRTG